MTMGITDLFYGTPMEENDHGYLTLDLIPDEKIKQCDLLKIACNRNFYFKLGRECLA